MITYTEAINHPAEYMDLFIGNKTISGIFTNGRVNRNTIPKGKYAYDLRENTETGEFASIEPHVTVNHAGTFIGDEEIIFPSGTDKRIPFNEKEYDYSFT